MKHTHILFVILAIILCVGCDYIQSPEEAAGENKNDLQYVNMDGLRRELADIRSTSFENLDIKNCAFFDVPDKMYEAKLLQAGDLLQKENQIFESYVPKKTFKKKYYKKNPNSSPPGPEYENTETGERLLLGNNGFINYRKSEKSDEIEEENLLETVWLDRKYENKTYQLQDGTISLKQAVELAKKEEEKWEKTVTKNVLKSRPSKVDVYKNGEDGSVFLRFCFRKTYHGVEELVQKKLMESADTKSLSVEYADCYDDQIVVSSCKGADSFLSNEGVMYEAEKQKEIKTVLSLQSALKLVSKELPSYHGYHISKISICYRMCSDAGKESEHEAGEKYTTSPCYLMLFSEKENQEEFALVDCKTGTVDYVRNY